jgi:DNA-binding XRE family transcriptional regulator
MERDLSGELVFVNPPWELAEQICCHFESCSRTTSTSTMAAFVLSKWAEFNELTRHWKLYQEFLASTQLFTRPSLDEPTQ